MKQATNDQEAKEWLEKLAKLGKMLQDIIHPLQENSFRFMRSHDFGEFQITTTHNIYEFLTQTYEFYDATYIFLLGIFDSPYIEDTDELKPNFEDISISVGDYKKKERTGIAAAHIKDSIAVSLDNDTIWNTCELQVNVHKWEEVGYEIKENSTTQNIKHISKKVHIRNCHLPCLSDLYNWKKHQNYFDTVQEEQNLLPLVEIHKLFLIDLLSLDEDIDTQQIWDIFYKKISIKNGEEIGIIENFAKRIAIIHRWEYMPTLSKRNNRSVYRIDTKLFVGVDTQHGEWEIHSNNKGNNHLGALSFDGKKFKNQDPDRKLELQ